MRTSPAGAVGKSISIIFSTVLFATAGLAGDQSLRQLEAGLSDLIFHLSRSIVTVEATRPAPSIAPGSGGLFAQTIVTTGVVYDSAGHIVAAADAIAGYDQIQVTGEERSVPAKVVAVDYRNNVALLIPDLPVGAPASLGEPSVCAGQMVLSLASAYGLRASPSIGFCAGSRPDGMLQFSLPTISTVAGGGVFDLSGGLVGIVTGDLGNPAQMALAIPTRKLSSVVDYLLNNGSRQAGFIGVASRSIVIDPPIDLNRAGPVSHAGIRPGRLIDRGVLIADVMPGSPAFQAGIQVDDLILELDGTPVSSSGEFAGLIAGLDPGHLVAVKLVRRGVVVTAQVRIGPRPSAFSQRKSSGPIGRDRTADSLYQLLDRLREEMSRVERRLQSID